MQSYIVPILDLRIPVLGKIKYMTTVLQGGMDSQPRDCTEAQAYLRGTQTAVSPLYICTPLRGLPPTEDTCSSEILLMLRNCLSLPLHPLKKNMLLLNNLNTQWRTQTYNSNIKSCMLYRLNQLGAPTLG